MRIGLISTLATPVRREGSGSVELLVWLLADQLTRLGHGVTVFGAPGSIVPGRLVASVPGTYGTPGAPDWQMNELANVAAAVAGAADLDVLHSHSYLWGLPFEQLTPVPMVHTLHVMPHEAEHAAARLFPDAVITALSDHQWGSFPGAAAVTVRHGLDASDFPLGDGAGGYLCYFGRFTPEKGPLHAIRAARSAGMPLVLAGPRNDYFTEVVEPLLGPDVRYVGTVTGSERADLLGHASVLLYPITYGEPFGLVLIEAMMCGTPVAAMRLGAVPEIVKDGVTGILAGDGADLAEAALRAAALNRRVVRLHCEATFSAGRMAAEYLVLYERLVARVPA